MKTTCVKCGSKFPDWPPGWPDPICPMCVAARQLTEPLELGSGKDAGIERIETDYEDEMNKIEGRSK